MKYRDIKISPEGAQPRERVREVVRAVHVMPFVGRRWVVRTSGVKPVVKTFRDKSAAMRFADTLSQKRDSKVVLHVRKPKRVKARTYQGGRAAKELKQ